MYSHTDTGELSNRINVIGEVDNEANDEVLTNTLQLPRSTNFLYTCTWNKSSTYLERGPSGNATPEIETN